MTSIGAYESRTPSVGTSVAVLQPMFEKAQRDRTNELDFDLAL